MSFGISPTRNIQAGDTPDLNDGQQSIRMAAQNIPRGTMCAIVLGIVTIATAANSVDNSRFVPIESKDNSAGSPGDLEIKGVSAPQKVALKLSTDGGLTVGEFVEVSAAFDGEVKEAAAGAKVARYLGKEAALLNTNVATPFEQTLTEGVVPEQLLLAGEIGWFQLIEVSDNG